MSRTPIIDKVLEELKKDGCKVGVYTYDTSAATIYNNKIKPRKRKNNKKEF